MTDNEMADALKAKGWKVEEPWTRKPDVTYEGSYAWREEQAKFRAPDKDPA